MLTVCGRCDPCSLGKVPQILPQRSTGTLHYTPTHPPTQSIHPIHTSHQHTFLPSHPALSICSSALLIKKLKKEEEKTHRPINLTPSYLPHPHPSYLPHPHPSYLPRPPAPVFPLVPDLQIRLSLQKPRGFGLDSAQLRQLFCRPGDV